MGCKACDKPKPNYRKGLWSPEEDQKLRDYIIRHGHGCWSALPAKAGKTNHPPPCLLHFCRVRGERNSGGLGCIAPGIQSLSGGSCRSARARNKNGVVIRRN